MSSSSDQQKELKHVPCGICKEHFSTEKCQKCQKSICMECLISKFCYVKTYFGELDDGILRNPTLKKIKICKLCQDDVSVTLIFNLVALVPNDKIKERLYQLKEEEEQTSSYSDYSWSYDSSSSSDSDDQKPSDKKHD